MANLTLARALAHSGQRPSTVNLAQEIRCSKVLAGAKNGVGITSPLRPMPRWVVALGPNEVTPNWNWTAAICRRRQWWYPVDALSGDAMDISGQAVYPAPSPKSRSG